MLSPPPGAGTVDFLTSLEMSDDELAKAIIGTIGDVDSYQLPGEAGRRGGAVRNN